MSPITDEEKEQALDWLLKQTIRFRGERMTVMKACGGDPSGRINFTMNHVAEFIAEYHTEHTPKVLSQESVGRKFREAE
jgi:hypothetical protein